MLSDLDLSSTVTIHQPYFRYSTSGTSPEAVIRQWLRPLTARLDATRWRTGMRDGLTPTAATLSIGQPWFRR